MHKRGTFRIVSISIGLGFLLMTTSSCVYWTHIHKVKRELLKSSRTVTRKQPLVIPVKPSRRRLHKTLNIIVYTDTYMHDVSPEQSTVFLGKNRTLPSKLTLTAIDKDGKSYQAAMGGYLKHKLVFSFSDKIPKRKRITEIRMTSERDIVLNSVLWLDCTPW